jgi:hypothetical protein
MFYMPLVWRVLAKAWDADLAPWLLGALVILGLGLSIIRAVARIKKARIQANPMTTPELIDADTRRWEAHGRFQLANRLLSKNAGRELPPQVVVDLVKDLTKPADDRTDKGVGQADVNGTAEVVTDEGKVPRRPWWKRLLHRRR